MDFQAQGYKTWVDFFLEVNLFKGFFFKWSKGTSLSNTVNVSKGTGWVWQFF